ncbi:MAG: type I phosphomannose isomerase catalytic subunit [Verrucomicrobiia bacterium]
MQKHTQLQGTKMLYPYKFTPLLVERVWGGQTLARFGKPVPPGKRIGESWEISDRDEAQTVVANGPDRGKTLRQLIEAHGVQLLGTNCFSSNTPTLQHSTPSRLPLLVKLLDCRERLSLQVHPPAAIAAKLNGEPKTEMWYVLDADVDAHLIAGLRRGVSGVDFIRALERCSGASAKRLPSDEETALHSPRRLSGQGNAATTVAPSIEDCVHRFPVVKGDTFFVPSGRLHAIDAGVVFVEIQQNSDTTYRVYDWGRVGLDGKPRQLHVQESLACIDFQDFEPRKVKPKVENHGVNGLWRLVECDYFHIHKLDLRNAWPDRCDGSSFHILACVEGAIGILTPDNKEERLDVGQFGLLPAALGHYTVVPQAEVSQALKVVVPSAL